MEGYYRIQFDGLRLNGKGSVLLDGGRIHGIKGGGHYDFDGKYRRQAKGGAVDVELDVRIPGGAVVTLKFSLPDETPQQTLSLATADGPLTVSLHRLHSAAPEQRGLEHL